MHCHVSSIDLAGGAEGSFHSVLASSSLYIGWLELMLHRMPI